MKFISSIFCTTLVAGEGVDDALNLLQTRVSVVVPPQTCVEGYVEQAEYVNSDAFVDYDAAEKACLSKETCKGLWQRGADAKWRPLYSGKRNWKKGVPNYTVKSVKICNSNPKPQGTCVEGEVSNAEYVNSDNYKDYDAAVAACTARTDCKGLWQRVQDKRWRPLYAGKRFWKKGKPNGTVGSVKSCTSDVTGPAQGTCTEGAIKSAEYTRESYKDYEKATAACVGREDCKGLWQRVADKRWRPLYDGKRNWQKGVPNDTVGSVKVCTPIPHPHVEELAEGECREGEVYKAEYTSEAYHEKSAATKACVGRQDCKGVWQRVGDQKWRPLYDGTRYWKKGKPNDTVGSVLTCKPAPAPEVPESGCVEGSVNQAEYVNSDAYVDYEAAVTACLGNAKCKGLWQRGADAKWRPLYEGKRNWRKGVPNGTVKSVKACTVVTTTTTTAAVKMFEVCPEEGKENTNVCPEGCAPVDDCDQCKLAAEDWGKPFSDEPIPEGATRPTGCFRNRKYLIKCNKKNPEGPYRGKFPICQKV